MCIDAHKVWYVDRAHVSPKKVLYLSFTRITIQFLEAQLRGCPIVEQGCCGPIPKFRIPCMSGPLFP